MAEFAALGRYGSKTVLVTRDGEVVEKADAVLLLFRPSFHDHPILQNPHVKIYDLAGLWAFLKPTHNVSPSIEIMAGQKPSNPEESAYLCFKIMDELLRFYDDNKAEIEPYLHWLKNQGGFYQWPWLDYLKTGQNEVDILNVLDIIDKLETVYDIHIEPEIPNIQNENFRPSQDIYHEALNDFLGSKEDHKSFLAQGGTGVGKTRAYLSAALKTNETVWVSTFTKTLQKQVQNEAATILGITPAIRKGRANYLCLKIFKQMIDAIPSISDGTQYVGLMTMMRWVALTQDGDISGGDFPAWISQLYGPQHTVYTTDRFRECNYQACPFFEKCFAETAKERGSQSNLVVTNHAMMASLLHYRPDSLPKTLIMDEAHHVASVMDDTFQTGFSTLSVASMNLFLSGTVATERRKARKGFLDSLKDHLAKEDHYLINKVAQIAQFLNNHHTQYMYMSDYLTSVYETVHAHQKNTYKSQFDLEVDREYIPRPSIELMTLLNNLYDDCYALFKCLELREKEANEEGAGDPFVDTKKLLFERAVLLLLRGWITQFEQLDDDIPDNIIEWGAIKKQDGQVMDHGVYRTFLDPLKAWQNLSQSTINKTIYTTATKTKDLEAIVHNSIDVDSPFDYINHSKIIILQDVSITSPAEVGDTILSLSNASNGGALGVFTAISNLKATHHYMRQYQGDYDLNLLAQHIDPIDIGTLINIFRHEPRSVLLGTDAVRDGIDIPGKSLHLMIFDRVPWSRPNAVHQARKNHYGGRDYEENQVRLRLRQAYGRLIRSESDKGVFVICDKRLPSRLYDAFPKGVSIEKMTLEQAVQSVKDFL